MFPTLANVLTDLDNSRSPGDQEQTQPHEERAPAELTNREGGGNCISNIEFKTD